MKITAHSYKDGKTYWVADGYFKGIRILVEAQDRLAAIIGWINLAQERAE